jgi:hypothetical protein
MPTGPDRIAVLALQLARTDRRALSQAWYDTLHVAVQEQLSMQTQHRGSPAFEQHAVATHGAGPSAPASRIGAGAVARRSHDASHVEGVASVRREAQRIRITAALATARPIARTVAIGDHRVRLLVRSDAGGTRVVAICAAADRDRVARALAGVRVALAGAGVTVAA